jgi:hypothetical protein
VLGLGLLLLRLRLPGALGQGTGRGLPLTVHDQQRPKKDYFTNPAQPCKIAMTVSLHSPDHDLNYFNIFLFL